MVNDQDDPSLSSYEIAGDIEKSLTLQTDGQQVEEWLELANGCKSANCRCVSVLRQLTSDPGICCSVK